MSYEEKRDAQRAYQKRLQLELAEIQEELSETHTLRERKKNLSAELSSMSVKRSKRVALPLLSRISVAAPCHENWDEMKGDDRVRHCGSCQANVFNLSSLSETGVGQLLAEHGHDICVNFYQRKDGTVMTKDCKPGHRRRRRQRVVASVVGVTAIALSFTELTTYAPVEPCDEPNMVSGQMSVSPASSAEGPSKVVGPGDEPDDLPRMIRGKMMVTK